MSNRNTVSLNIPADTLIELLNALHNANNNGAVAAQLANALAARKLKHRDPDAEVDSTASFQEQDGLADEEKAHLQTFTEHFSFALNAVCCHRKDGVICGPDQPPCPGDPVPTHPTSGASLA